ncbi:hypothetical protein PG993_004257 [Apiospora rasikravindrae]|uniref:S-adenosyl-L-methionine-dependent methyltransferase n=1 Tax=Apiospora rasikravindrae TaxID=990691 RepID=A0ABR1TC96_9PEZI
MSGSQPGGDKPIKVEPDSGHISAATVQSEEALSTDTWPGDPKSRTSYSAGPIITGFMPDELLPEDVPVVDPRYLDPSMVSATSLSETTTGIPPEEWIPSEIYRKSSGASVFEPLSVAGESGRLYHGYKEGKYFLPNDAAEQDRLDLQHQGFKILLEDRLYLAPIKEPRRVLDIGTGTGIWAIDFGSSPPSPFSGDYPIGLLTNRGETAQAHPQAEVIGTDLSLIQPETGLMNVKFIREDVEDQWVFPHKFDYIHARMVFSCFDNPRGVMEQAFQFLEPGGWVEYFDAGDFANFSRPQTPEEASMDGTGDGTTIQRWGRLSQQGLRSRGRDPDVMRHYKGWMQEIGFVDVVERKIAAPQGGWAKSPRLKLAGRYFEREVYDSVKGLSFGMLRAAGLSAEEIEAMVDQIRVDLLNPHIHTYVPARVVYGRKPLEGEIVGSGNDQVHGGDN